MSTNEKDLGKIEYIEKPELVIGLVGAVGLQCQQLSDILQEEFGRVNYDVAQIHLSRLLEEIFGSKDRQEENEYMRIDRLMDQGQDS
jgi:hypothetical protein